MPDVPDTIWAQVEVKTLAVAVARTLGEVLTGRDRVPAWRSRGARVTASLLGWAGFALLGLSGLAGLIISGRGHRGPHDPAFPHGPGAIGWLAVALTVCAALPLAHRYALLAWRVAFLGVLVTPLIPGQTRADGGYYAVLAITLAVAGVRYGPRHLWCMCALSLIPVWLWTGPDWVHPVVNTGWLALLAVAGHAVTYWRRDRAALEAQTERAERQGERNAVLTERARIAREMHDVVAHHMSLIAVQAETAPYRVPDLPEPAKKEFAALSDAAREALTEMRRLLGVLRSEGTESDNSNKRAELAPQPRLADVPELVETARRAGATITLTMTESPDSGIPPGVGLAAYRIVQESVSNAGRHAPGAAVRVTVGEEERGVRIMVGNDPPAAPHGADAGTRQGPSGHGITGMRERAALLGGTLDAGPTPDGGFAVCAELPVAEPSSVARVAGRGPTGETTR